MKSKSEAQRLIRAYLAANPPVTNATQWYSNAKKRKEETKKSK